ncbi:DUF1707 SHOCT-like domain-containing protein [Marinactinospora thermotolerans]|uniref:DUF1707 domain-containing protein n=1 Tax=Marinactinospora thermotolerans DSM 45154 TaxID=1122192 RepID=A0A1T4RTT7_9ACTN|nr:DUF1707 domain-containing protein [Marinactinospora thermotolerans]SKA19307.1 protein of unknown function [Marinactinospora thermotolerans DSM 45154]
MSPDEVNNALRASDADRERVAEILRDAAAEGRITLEELDERLDLTYRARTYADLAPLTADLPATSSGVAVAGSEGGLVPGGTERTLELKAKGSTITRTGAWRVPGQIIVKNPYGTVRLDFRKAVFTTSVVDIDITLSWGEAKLILPDHASAEIEVDTSWLGTIDSRVNEVADPPAPHLRITGKAAGATLKVRYGSRFDNLVASWGTE